MDMKSTDRLALRQRAGTHESDARVLRRELERRELPEGPRDVYRNQAAAHEHEAFELRREAMSAETRAAIAALHRRAMEEALWQRGLDAGELNVSHPLTFARFYDRLHDALLEGLERAVLEPDVEPWEPDDREEAEATREAAAEAELERRREAGFPASPGRGASE